MAQDGGLKWPPPPPISVRNMVTRGGTALVLSGGGATGSFEVGVLQYLYRKLEFRPRIICSTSVGSVNALKLAEGEGDGTDPNRGFQGLCPEAFRNVCCWSDILAGQILDMPASGFQLGHNAKGANDYPGQVAK
jgi:hypothetical protein